jgi:hypothetical protein
MRNTWGFPLTRVELLDRFEKLAPPAGANLPEVCLCAYSLQIPESVTPRATAGEASCSRSSISGHEALSLFGAIASVFS